MQALRETEQHPPGSCLTARKSKQECNLKNIFKTMIFLCAIIYYNECSDQEDIYIGSLDKNMLYHSVVEKIIPSFSYLYNPSVVYSIGHKQLHPQNDISRIEQINLTFNMANELFPGIFNFEQNHTDHECG